MASSSDNLYITFVDVDRDLLKVWGQRNRVGATYIEKQLLQLIPEFKKTQCPNPSRIRKGMFCFAKYTDENYYRARVISNVQGDCVGVLFVDYGNKGLINISNIRIQEGREGDVLAKMAEQAEEYYLARVVAPVGGWTESIVSEVRRDICCDEFFSRIVDQVGDQKVLEIQFQNQGFSDYLIKKQLARPISLPAQRQLILSYCSLIPNESNHNILRDLADLNYPKPSLAVPNQSGVKPPPQPTNMMSELPEVYNYGKQNSPVNYSQPPPPIPSHFSSSRHMNAMMQNAQKMITPKTYYTSPSIPNNQMLRNENRIQPLNPQFNPMQVNRYNPAYQMKGNQEIPLLNNVVIEALAHQIKQYITEDNAKSGSEAEKIPHNYVSSVLEVGSTHNVLVSHIDDGPWSFSVQLLSSESELNKLMEELASTDLIPVKPPLILGHPCIGSSAVYGNLCRGVIVSISHSAVKVYFVDFGNTEDLPVTSLYELPPKFFKIRVLSQKFSLSGLQKVTYSDDIKRFFKEVVQDELLMLRVTSLEGDNLPTCELYHKDRNIKRLLNEKIRDLKTSQDEFPKVGDIVDVVVTWVESPEKFFLQLRDKDPELNALKRELANTPRICQPLNYQELSVGLKCICQYSSDEQWYRVVITSFKSENAITVFYIDYGNMETVNISLLRKIDGYGLAAQMGVQAIQCGLKGFEGKPFDQALTNDLESLILEKDLKMKVVSGDKDRLIVELYENDKDIASMLLARSQRPVPNTQANVYQNKENVSGWKDMGEHIQQSPSKPEQKPRYSGDSDSSEKKDNKSFRTDRTNFSREKNVNNRQFPDLKSDRFQSPHTTQTQSRRRFEDKTPKREDTRRPGDVKSSFRQEKENNWNDKKSFGGNSGGPDKSGWNRGTKQMEGWSDTRGSDKSNFVKQSSQPEDSNDWRSCNKPKFDENRNRKKKIEDIKPDGRMPEKNFGFRDNRAGDFGAKKKFPDVGGNDKKLSEPKRQPVKKEDLVPSNSKFQERTIEIGSCHTGIVTFFLSPHEFFVQLLNQEVEFKKMMGDIQSYYNDKYSIRDPVKRDDIVIAQFSDDKVLYRAEVIKPSPVTVRYVDYGNQEAVGPKCTWPVVKQFMHLPKQAVKCRLSNIKPVGTEWPPPRTELGKFFAFPKYNCKFLKFEDGVYEVSLEILENEKDLASEIVAAGLGLPETPKISVDEIDLTLLPGQLLKLYVTHVESSSKFYVILNPKSVKDIEDEIKAFTVRKENLKPLDKSTLQPGTKCLSTNDDLLWHRGTITEVVENRVILRFDDSGDSVNVTADKIMGIPDHLKNFQAQAFVCCLDGISESLSSSEEEEFKNAIERKHHLFHIKSVTDERLFMVLYDSEGQKSNLQKCSDSPQSVKPLSQLPILSQGIPLMVSHIETPLELYIQRASDWYETENLSQQLAEFYEENNEEDEVGKDGIQGELVAAKSVEHQTWYRAQVVSSSEETIEVVYLDFGNKENLPRGNVKKLDPSFHNLNIFARKVSLPVKYDPNCETVLNNKISELVGDKDTLGYFWNDKGNFFTEFVIEGKKLRDVWRSMDGITPVYDLFKSNVFDRSASNVKPVEEETVTTKTMTTEAAAASEPTAPPSSSRNVFVSHIDSPNQFWVHQEGSINDLNNLQEKLQNECQGSPDKENPQVGEVVAVHYSGMWYRAEVVKSEGSNNLTVKFIDYGNVLKVEGNWNPVKELPLSLLNVPTFATRYSLKGIWEDSFTSRFEEIIMQLEDPVKAVILEDGDPKIVDLFKDGQSIAEKLLEDSCVEEEEEVHKEEEDLSTVYITHGNSPDDFYIQRESSTVILDNLSRRLSEVENFVDVSFVQEKETYVAKFSEDDEWYRAKVIEKGSNETKVFFIDFGNTSLVTELKHLPEDLLDIPPLSENCSLLNGNNSDDWSEAACDKFSQYCDGRPLKMKVVVNRVKKPIVKLFFEDCDISEELDNLCEADGRVEVYVSEAKSPTDFYIQYVNDNDFKKITEVLNREGDFENLEDRKPGTLCQALFEGDGLWYRAKIIQNFDEGCEVFFIDYGNSSVSTKLRKLPLELEEIPPRAFRCSLDLLETNIPESVKEEFIMLTSDSDAVFRGKILTSGDVNIISLKLNGRILEQTLFLDVIPEGNHSTYDDLSHRSDLHGSLDDETDDDKNSKKFVMNDHYLSSNFDDVMTGNSVRNETDEEKRVKIAISTVDGGLEGFKSDDEKGISESGVFSNIVNVTDNDLIEESQEEHVEDTPGVSLSRNRHDEERVEEIQVPNEVSVGNDINDESPPESTDIPNSENKTETEDTHETKIETEAVASGDQSGENYDKIVSETNCRKDEKLPHVENQNQESKKEFSD